MDELKTWVGPTADRASDFAQSLVPPRRRYRVTIEERDDGGLRVYSDDIPGLVLSHSDRSMVLRDIGDALAVFIAPGSTPHP